MACAASCRGAVSEVSSGQRNICKPPHHRAVLSDTHSEIADPHEQDLVQEEVLYLGVITAVKPTLFPDLIHSPSAPVKLPSSPITTLLYPYSTLPCPSYLTHWRTFVGKLLVVPYHTSVCVWGGTQLITNMLVTWDFMCCRKAVWGSHKE